MKRDKKQREKRRFFYTFWIFFHETALIEVFLWVEKAVAGKGDVKGRFPGMNKVTQAVGRLIRTPTDQGSALLIDDRYTQGEYRDVFGRLWPDAQIVLSPQEVRSSLLSFYKEKQK